MKNRSVLQRREQWSGVLFTLPVILGILIFNFGPMIFSFYCSFTDYDNLTAPNFIGLQNYIGMFHSSRFWNSIFVTLQYAAESVSLGLVMSFLVALLMNSKLKGIKIFRTLIYTPVIVPVVAASFVWKDLYGKDYGLINTFFGLFGIGPFSFLSSPKTAVISLVIMSLWGVGGGMLIWLAGFNGISTSYYEAADIDGASSWSKLIHITIPLVTPVIFYNLVMSLIGSLQTFNQAFIMTSGGPLDATNFIALNIYTEGFANLKMGLASAEAWFLFLIIIALTGIIFKTSKWVYYGD